MPVLSCGGPCCNCGGTTDCAGIAPGATGFCVCGGGDICWNSCISASIRGSCTGTEAVPVGACIPCGAFPANMFMSSFKGIPPIQPVQIVYRCLTGSVGSLVAAEQRHQNHGTYHSRLPLMLLRYRPPVRLIGECQQTRRFAADLR